MKRLQFVEMSKATIKRLKFVEMSKATIKRLKFVEMSKVTIKRLKFVEMNKKYQKIKKKIQIVSEWIVVVLNVFLMNKLHFTNYFTHNIMPWSAISLLFLLTKMIIIIILYI